MPPVETENAALSKDSAPGYGRNDFPIKAGLITLAVLVVIGAVIGVWSYDSGAAARAVISEAMEAMRSGDFQSVREQLRPIIEDGVPSAAYFAARSVDDAARFATGEADERIAAVRSAKDLYQTHAGNPFEQSRQINTVLGYLNAGFEKYIYDEVFSGEPFARFLVPGDRASSIRNLAEHSFELAPGTASHFRIGQWYADRIRNLYGDWDGTPEEKQAYADEILRILDENDAILAAELRDMERGVFQATIVPRFHFWESFLYGAVARVRPQYVTEALDSLKMLEDHYDAARDEHGQRNGLIAMRLPYTYANYAWTLYEVRGPSSYEAVREYLEKLVALVDENPSLHKGHYLSLVEKNATLSPEKRATTYSARMMMRLGEVSPVYKEFLARHGFEY